MPTVASHQGPLIGIAALMRHVQAGTQLSDLINMAAYDPSDANMLMGLSVVFQLTGNREMGLELQAKALQIQQFYRLPCDHPPDLRLLAIMRPGDMMDNTPLEFLLEDSAVALDMLFVSPELPLPATLPDHDVAMVAIGQSDHNLALLEQVEKLLESSRCPVLNEAGRIAQLSRDSVSGLLQSVPGLEIPLTKRIGRNALQQLGNEKETTSSLLEDGSFPIIVRPLDSHGGTGLARLDSPADIAGYLAAMPQAEFNIARFVDYRSPDGLYRKCRIALIDGKPYACHLAISGNWMIHYKSAGMEDSASKRAEEENFMSRFDQEFACRHGEAFRMVGKCLGLDYLVMDCAETPTGKLLVFEADNLGFVHAMDPVDIFPYKQPQMRKVFDAFQAMLRKAAAQQQAGIT